jgi:hypothetical protein
MTRPNVSRIRTDVKPPGGFITVAAFEAGLKKLEHAIAKSCDESVARLAGSCGAEVAAAARGDADQLLADLRKVTDDFRAKHLRSHDQG